MVAVPMKTVEVLRGVLWLTSIERAEAQAAGDQEAVASKEQSMALLERRLADLEMQAGDELAARILH